MNVSVTRDPVLYIDCTSTFRSSLNTGVQRVVQALVAEADVFGEYLCLEVKPICYQFNGFYRLDDASKITLQSIEQFTPVDFCYGDIYLCPDAFWTMGMTDWYPFLRERGVSIATLIYDLIPLTHPEYCTKEDSISFEKGLLVALAYSDLLPCISRETRKSLLNFCKVRNIPVAESLCPVIPLAPAIADRQGCSEEIKRLPEKDFFLMVGTIEPRRGYLEALKEYAAYRAHGGDACLLILGKAGAGANDILQSFEKNADSVTWISDATDSELLAAYKRARAVIVASKAEGYGLPVAEGLLFNGLVLANRLAVFGEFAGSLPYYFDIGREGSLAQLLADALNLRKLDNVLELGAWKATACALAAALQRISPRYGHQLSIELHRNSEAAVRWAHWLCFGRKCRDEDLPLWLKFDSVSSMFDAMRFEERKLDAELTPNSVRWVQSVLNGRVGVSDEEVGYWLRACRTVRDLRETLLYANRQPDAPLTEDLVKWAHALIDLRTEIDDVEVHDWISRCITLSDLRRALLVKHQENI